MTFINLHLQCKGLREGTMLKTNNGVQNLSPWPGGYSVITK